jgi:AcrR family transcriptional regulator
MSTRDRMLDAAAHVMRTRGLARATTKEIAKEAGYSEAALYKHFRDKTDLFLAVLNERAPNTLATLLGQLGQRVGQAVVRETLEDIARAAIAFYRHNFPMAASLFSEPRLLAAHRQALRERGTGPARVGEAVAGYLSAERDLGRIRSGADPQAAAALLLGACFQHAFLSHFADRHDDEDSDRRFAATLADTLATGLLPGPATDHSTTEQPAGGRLS